MIGVVATAGTTNAGIIDDLAGVADVAAERRLWFHVDAAYGGAALLAPSVRPLFDGIERADSMIVDPHKWLFAPFDCAALLYREPRLAKAVHTQDAAYLEILHDPGAVARDTDAARGTRATTPSTSPGGRGACPCGSHWPSTAPTPTATPSRRCSRRPAAAPSSSRRRRTSSSCASRCSRWCSSAGRVGTAADYEQWSNRLLADQIGFVTPTTWEGEPVARFAFLHPDTSLEMVGEILASTA